MIFMAKSEEQRSSLQAFIEQTAQMIRSAVKAPSGKKRKISKEKPLSSTNKIKQIAKMLRTQVEKVKKPVKRKKNSG